MRGECCQNCHHRHLHIVDVVVVVVVVVVAVVHVEEAKVTEKELLEVISCSPCLKINMSKYNMLFFPHQHPGCCDQP